MNERDDLERALRSRTPILALQTREERRALELLRQLRQRLPWPVYKWTLTEGLTSLAFDFAIEGRYREPDEILRHLRDAAQAGVYVLVDFHPFLNDPVNVRLLKDIALHYETNPRTVVLLSHELDLPDELGNHAVPVRLRLPDRETIRRIVLAEARRWKQEHPGRKVGADRQALELLINNLTGLTAAEARRLAHQAIFDDGAIDASDLPRVMQAKYELLNQEGVLHYEFETERFADIGGFRRLREWLARRRSAFHDPRPGLDAPKGILLLGVQGCGKSLAARAVAGIWGIPLLRLDFATLYNKYHGETERNLRESLRAAEAMAPCVLWIDEIEKGLSTSDSDAGTSRRVLGTLLTWMAEQAEGVFLVATANDISALPPELIRKGRLDEIFFVDLPDPATRKRIAEIHLRKRGEDPLHFNTGELARRTEGFSGAEIEQLVVSALYAAHARGTPLRDADLFAEAELTRPLSVVMAERIDALRDWARTRTVSVD